jgi:hypothetical protein
MFGCIGRSKLRVRLWASAEQRGRAPDDHRGDLLRFVLGVIIAPSDAETSRTQTLGVNAEMLLQDLG